MKKTAVGLAAITMLCGCAVAPLENPTAQSCSKYYKSGKKETAEAVCRAIAERGDLEGFYYLAKIERDRGSNLQSLEMLYKAGTTRRAEYNKAAEEQLQIALSAKQNKNYKPSLEVFKKLASQKNTRAKKELGDMFYSGLGVKPNLKQAIYWYKEAAESGDLYSQNQLDKIFGKETLKGGGLYLLGRYSEAIDVWKPIADAGHAEAQVHMGDLYRKGNIGDPDYSLAREWYRKAADQNSSYGAYMLGYLLRNGKGGARNPNEAYKYLKQAANMGESRAYYHVAHILTLGTGAEVDYAKARYWYEKALSERPTHLVYEGLAKLYRDGQGGETDIRRAKELFQLAIDAGNRFAKSQLEELEKREKIKLRNQDSPVLFGLKLYGATRAEMREKIKEAGAQAIREDYNYWADTYFSSNLMQSSERMLVFYSISSDSSGYGSSGDYLAQIQYEFGSRSLQFFREIKELLTEKYGETTYVFDSIKLGYLTHTWEKNGVIIKLEKEWENSEVILYYDVDEFKERMDAEIKEFDKKKKLSKYEGSSSAY
ncbi:tetratricopeptide repeat protein [Paraferrimonas sedimenticola]|uniref:TPR repeat n=1 Tax=Paraferrimonas sedimenticola TaxID=375674 RepID=A0AA37RNK8_9GAMM|nr:tetratricopeptide repeat protein [Paraferrimonas sedimenticola]GLP94696.1 hypothetical protein GCM10007895_00020 [Paraferrimonas sedimenticola]